MRSGWLVGLLGVIALAYITVNSLRTEGVGSRGPAAGRMLPPFAMPLAGSDADADVVANLATRPDSGAEGARPACEVRGPEILNSCELAERGPVVLAFTAGGSEGCERQVDVLDRAARRFGDVAFAAIGVLGERRDLRAVARERGWRIPVGHDGDGAVANRYSVAVCPLVTFAARGGVVAGTAVAFLDDAELARRVEALRAGRPLPASDPGAR